MSTRAISRGGMPASVSSFRVVARNECGAARRIHEPADLRHGMPVITEELHNQALRNARRERAAAFAKVFCGLDSLLKAGIGGLVGKDGKGTRI